MQKLIFTLMFVSACCTGAVADENPHLYSTGRIMEVDRCASAWLIKRFADPQAEFAFFEDGQLITIGTAFDTPDARFSRTHSQSTFEVLMRHFNISDPKLKSLAAAIHEIEINYWAGAKDNPLASELEIKVKNIIRAKPEPEQCLEQCFRFFDQLMEKLPG